MRQVVAWFEEDLVAGGQRTAAGSWRGAESTEVLLLPLG
jgi:hypothetical protein